jgi:peroxiredoxin
LRTEDLRWLVPEQPTDDHTPNETEWAAWAEWALAPLSVGTRPPDFALPQVVQAAQAQDAQSSNRLRLRRVGRRQAVVLAFYPMDWEPVSREQLTLYQGYTDTFTRLGARLLGISCDHVYSHEAFARDAQLYFPLLADFHPRGQVARQYGVWREAQSVSARANFVLDRQRVIRFSKTYPDQLNPGVDELLTILEALAAENEATGQR